MALPPEPRIRPSTLTHNVLIFGRLLRASGIPMSAGREMELLRALELIDLGDRRRVYEACLAMLVSRRDHKPVFDRAFELFFAGFLPRPFEDAEQAQRVPVPIDADDVLPPDVETVARDVPFPDEAARTQVAPTDESQDQEAGDDAQLAQTYSAAEMLREKDFDRYSAEELAQARDLMRQLRLGVPTRLTRRMVRSPRGRHLDMRRIVRGLHRTGGEPAKLAWRERKLKRRKIVLICDVSGSMERYSRLLLQFLHAVRQGLAEVEVFVFGTRLTRVTRYLAHKNVDAALDYVGEHVLDFAGGTRIGRSLHQFNHDWARRVLGHGAVLVIISDGWDRGDPALLREEMERLQRTSFRVIWLNPLLGLPEYEPITVGMRTALEFVDDFLPAHNLRSLEVLARRLSTLESRRPVRRQGVAAR